MKVPVEDARLSAGLGMTRGDERLHVVGVATSERGLMPPIVPTAEICPGTAEPGEPLLYTELGCWGLGGRNLCCECGDCEWAAGCWE